MTHIVEQVDVPLFKYTLKRGDYFNAGRYNFPVDLGAGFWDNYIIKAQARESSEGTLVHEFDLSSTTVTTEGSNGVLGCDIFALPNATKNWTMAKLLVDIELSSDNLKKITIARLEINIVPDITK